MQFNLSGFTDAELRRVAHRMSGSMHDVQMHIRINGEKPTSKSFGGALAAVTEERARRKVHLFGCKKGSRAFRFNPGYCDCFPGFRSLL